MLFVNLSILIMLAFYIVQFKSMCHVLYLTNFVYPIVSQMDSWMWSTVKY